MTLAGILSPVTVYRQLVEAEPIGSKVPTSLRILTGNSRETDNYTYSLSQKIIVVYSDRGA